MSQHYYCTACGNTTVSFVCEVIWDDNEQMFNVKEPDLSEPAWCYTCENETWAAHRVRFEAA